MAAGRGAIMMTKREVELRKTLWPEISEEDLWMRQQHAGFTTIPRTFPVISKIMNELSPGKPLASTYLALWCRVFDSCMLKIENPKVHAFEAGFSGNRMETTWKDRMKKLAELGFILNKGGAAGDFHHVLILNPYKVIQKLHEKNMIDASSEAYNTLQSRANEIGAKEF